jgi:RNA polymerase sigma-70 factor (ECF subfamily)
MSLDAMLDLLRRLEQGDDRAAEEVFVRFAPYLRIVVRRHLTPRLRAKFDSVDVVQSVWADLLRGFRNGNWRFNDPAQLQAFLVRATHNRFLNRVRHHQRELESEQPLPAVGDVSVPSREPRPSEVAQANDLWQQMLDVCPPAHRDLLRLKREGLPLEELAARTGLHPSSVRRIFYDLARRLEALPT